MRNLQSLSIILIVSLLSTSNVFAADNIYKDTLTAVNKKDWARADHLAKKTGSRALHKIVLSQKFIDGSCNSNKFEEIVHFLIENPGWAYENLLKAQAEARLNSNSNQHLIVKWFSKNKPMTGNGHKHYAYAAAELTKDQKNITKIIKKGWHFGNFSPDEQTKYYNKFKKHLSQEDHVKKIDNHLLNNQTTAAQQSFGLVDGGYKKAFYAQLDIIKDEKNATHSIRKVSSKHLTPGLVYHYLNARKKDSPNIDEVVSLINAVKKHSEYGDRFYSVQSYIARECIENKKYLAAYKVISNHFSTNPSDASNAEFLSGWLALQFLNKPKLAEKHFIKFKDLVKTPISKSRGLYWLGRTHAKLGEKEKSKQFYYNASKEYPYTFYGQAAAIELGHQVVSIPGNITLASYHDNKVMGSSDLYQATLIMAKHGSQIMTQTYLTAAANKYKDPKKMLALAHNISNLNNTHYNVWFAKVASQNDVFIRNMNFPRPYKLTGLPVEEALTYSIIRQESVFDHTAVSHANAKGLMQILDETACIAAKRIDLHCNATKLTRDPKYNITLGSNFLGKLIQDFDGSYILAIASYNAGPNKIKKWLKLFGDPRNMKNYHDVIDWIEIIPYFETRNYVHRVLENLQIYRSIIKSNSKLYLTQDLIQRKKL